MALIGQEITLKRLRRIDSECVELEAESTNPKHRNIRIDTQTEYVEILGVIVGAIVRCHTPGGRKPTWDGNPTWECDAAGPRSNRGTTSSFAVTATILSTKPTAIDLAKHILQIDGGAVGALIGMHGGEG